MHPKSAVEAALFYASESISASEIAKEINITKEEVEDSITALITEYDDKCSAITIVKVGTSYRMQLREEYVKLVKKFSKTELSQKETKIIATIAYNQPIMQSELVKKFGTGIYVNIRDLTDMGFINKKQIGSSFQLTTTKKFSEYFGIESVKIEDIRKWIENNEKRNVQT
ncbi:MAG: SMC-Scp complex subunit ScpB [archaeon]|nr:SMC-Scp complex subunit ScpB [archaeon]